MPCVTVGVARQRTLTTQWPWVPSKDKNLQPLGVKNFRVGRYPKQTINMFLTNFQHCSHNNPWQSLTNLHNVKITFDIFSHFILWIVVIDVHLLWVGPHCHHDGNILAPGQSYNILTDSRCYTCTCSRSESGLVSCCEWVNFLWYMKYICIKFSF